MCTRGQLRLYQPATKVCQPTITTPSQGPCKSKTFFLPASHYTPTLEEFSTSLSIAMLALQSYLIFHHRIIYQFFYFTFLILTLEGRKLLSLYPLLAKDTFIVKNPELYTGGIKCLAQKYSTESLLRLEPVTPRSQVKHSTTEPTGS